VSEHTRKALNEATFRAANEELRTGTQEIFARGGPPDAGSLVPFLCECHDVTCTDAVLLTFAEFNKVRASDRRSVIKVGHEDTAIERVIGGNDRFRLAEKFGHAGQVFAAETDSDGA
jgi:hypothetical protein